MRRSAIVVTCVLLVAALVSPSAAMAKGGNGRHSVATPGVSGHGKAKAAKGTAAKGKSATGKSHVSAAGKQSRKTTQPKAAAPQGSTANSAEKTTREAPRTEAADKAPKPQSAINERPAVGTASAKRVASSPPPTGFAEEQISSHTAEEAEMETRGVLDTIRAMVNASLEELRATVAGMWSSVASWLGI